MNEPNTAAPKADTPIDITSNPDNSCPAPTTSPAQSTQLHTQPNATMDILKFIMAILVVGIHTEPFGFNLWLDRGFGLITRLCVPFFFITSAYFYWSKDKGAKHFLKRILLLYLIWSIIYLPFDLEPLSNMRIGRILALYLWSGNFHGLWYLCGSAVGFSITCICLKFLKPKTVFLFSCLFLLIGCFKSTWSPLFAPLFSSEFSNMLGYRNGLFYAFPYTALGMLIAKSKDQGKNRKLKPLFIGFFISLIALIVECLIFVVTFNTYTTILWLSVLPYTYFFFMIGNNIHIQLKKTTSLYLRKSSILIYVSQYLFIPLFTALFFSDILLFITVSLSTILFAFLNIKLSERKHFTWLKYLY